MKTSKTIFLFFVPGLVLYSIFFLYPTVSALFYSFTDWDGFSDAFAFIGFDNFERAFTGDSIFRKTIGNNLKFMLVVVVFQTIVALAFAMILIKNTKTTVFLRALYFFPTILSSVSVAFIWAFVYDPSLGILNQLLEGIGLGFIAQNWLGNANIAIYSLAITQVWFHAGQMLIVFVAGLQAIPQEMYEVAKIEGASKWQTFRSVTWPLLAPSATIVVAYTTIQSFKAFDLVFAMTGGGPNNSTEIIATYIYDIAFRNYQFGYASAISVIFMIIIAIITFLQFKALRSDRVSY
ncbi:ABC transporter permease [Planococcus glaciei]|uniref:Sugar ABC transporter permease n=1 Tax=Planococcus glaciei TaxID=459472 RepID=A0A7H8QBD1_9BACL|nr:sugar ABC transporter permease [Planococcus glaciei]ETP70265.1 ABC transporter permease [Planococcus glaciei CHR43]KOF11016.1 ABC transporter permease [Planococcus glaciei]MBX0315734.1 sugar ABC transporter permease [Planococcus glaciei]QDY45482.1 sugar ABC transporter permease [Planococcus glaciei]QKX50563.1 sugar ABC transporter permease [Planococcus glaciei]